VAEQGLTSTEPVNPAASSWCGPLPGPGVEAVEGHQGWNVGGASHKDDARI